MKPNVDKTTLRAVPGGATDDDAAIRIREDESLYSFLARLAETEKYQLSNPVFHLRSASLIVDPAEPEAPIRIDAQTWFNQFCYQGHCTPSHLDDFRRFHEECTRVRDELRKRHRNTPDDYAESHSDEMIEGWLGRAFTRAIEWHAALPAD